MSSPRPANNEKTRLLNHDLVEQMDREPQVSWWRSAGRKIANAYRTVKTVTSIYLWNPTIKFVREHPIIMILGPLSAGTNGINATIAISGHSTKELLTGEWWKSMDDGKKAVSVLSGLSSLTINTLLFWNFALAFKQKLTNLAEEFRAPNRTTKAKIAIRAAIIASLLLGLGAALSAFAIGTDAWLWATLATGLIIGGFNGANTFLSRIFGILNVMHKIKDSRSEHVLTQKEYANTLRLVNPDHHAQINKRLRKNVELVLWESRLKNHAALDRDSVEWKAMISEPLTLQEYRSLTILLNRDLLKLASRHQNLILQKQLRSYIADYSGLIFDLAMAGTFALSGYVAFSQKGVDGSKIIANAIANVHLENVTSHGEQAGIGIVPGAATLISYGEAAFAFRMMMTYLLRSLYKHPSKIAPIVLLMFSIGLSALGNATIAKGIINNKDNYFGMEPGELMSEIFMITFIIGGAIANARMLTRVTPADEPANIDLQTIIDRNQETPEDFLDKAEQLVPVEGNDDLEAQAQLVDDDEEHYPLRRLGVRTKESMYSVSRIGYFGQHNAENYAPVQDEHMSENLVAAGPQMN